MAWRSFVIRSGNNSWLHCFGRSFMTNNSLCRALHHETKRNVFALMCITLSTNTDQTMLPSCGIECCWKQYSWNTATIQQTDRPLSLGVHRMHTCPCPLLDLLVVSSKRVRIEISPLGRLQRSDCILLTILLSWFVQSHCFTQWPVAHQSGTVDQSTSRLSSCRRYDMSRPGV